MIGGIIITHVKLGEELLGVLELISGKQENFHTISITSPDKVDEAREEIEKAIKDADQGKGVLIFTDMFGGTPSNLSLSFLDESNVEVITGVNIPMLLKFVDSRHEKEIKELANLVMEYGRKNISVASGRLYQDKKK